MSRRAGTVPGSSVRGSFSLVKILSIAGEPSRSGSAAVRSLEPLKPSRDPSLPTSPAAPDPGPTSWAAGVSRLLAIARPWASGRGMARSSGSPRRKRLTTSRVGATACVTELTPRLKSSLRTIVNPRAGFPEPPWPEPSFMTIVPLLTNDCPCGDQPTYP